MNLKRDKFDKVFSDYIRTRDKWTCVRCGRYYPEGMRGGLHCSHFYGRANKAVRWDEKNADSHCYGCHQFFGANPELFREWKLNSMGEKEYKALRRRSQEVKKWTTTEKEAMYKDYLAKIAKINKDNA